MLSYLILIQFSISINLFNLILGVFIGGILCWLFNRFIETGFDEDDLYCWRLREDFFRRRASDDYSGEVDPKTNKTRELFDYTQMEPDSVKNFEKLMAEYDDSELAYVEKVAGCVLLAARNVVAERIYAKEMKEKNEQQN